MGSLTIGNRTSVHNSAGDNTGEEGIIATEAFSIFQFVGVSFIYFCPSWNQALIKHVYKNTVDSLPVSFY